MNHLGTKKLETKRLILRPFNNNDYEEMYNNWANDSRVTKYMTWDPHKDINETKTLVNHWVNSYNKNNFYHWIIYLKEENIVIGSFSIVDINQDLEEVEIGYCIGYNWWNQGLVTEACKEILNYLLNEVQVKSVVAKHDSRNPASGKVMQKNNMVYQGEEPFVNKGEDITLIVYQIKKDD